jgi:hypothetical protein
MLEWAGHVIVTQRPAAAAAELIQRSGLPVLDMAAAGRFV